jgi:predicted membrane-bound spermidine synthase
VAATGLGVTYALPWAAGLVGLLSRDLLDTPWLINPLRFVLAFAVLLVPTTSMGATLPVLVAALPYRQYGFGRALGRLYGWNTLGAVAGVLGAELVLIDRLGVSGSAWVAAAISGGAALAALALSRRSGERQVDASLPPGFAFRGLQRLVGGAFLAGAALLALEVVWFRFLSTFVTSTTLAASLTLAVVLTGIAAGGLLASWWLRTDTGAAGYAGSAALVSCAVTAASYELFQFAGDEVRVTRWPQVLWYASTLTVATSVLSGVLFTLIGDALQQRIGSAPRAAGLLTVGNLAGATVGALTATFVLLPGLGMERSLFALAAAYAVIALLIQRDTMPHGSVRASRAFWATGLVATVVLGRFPFGLMSTTYVPRVLSPFTGDGARLVDTREGPTETISLLRRDWMDRPLYHRLVTNGFSMSGTTLSARRYMRFFVYWPAAVKQETLRRVLIICYGVGVTASAATDVDWVESIDVVEISPDIVAMSDAIYPPDRNPLHDERVHLHIEDGRQFLQATDQRFDLITGEPPPPTAARHGEPVLARVFSVDVRPPRRRRGQHVLVACRAVARIRHAGRDSRVLRCLRGLLALERHTVRSHAGRHARRQRTRVRGRVVETLDAPGTVGRAARRGFRDPRADGRDVSR